MDSRGARSFGEASHRTDGSAVEKWGGMWASRFFLCFQRCHPASLDPFQVLHLLETSISFCYCVSVWIREASRTEACVSVVGNMGMEGTCCWGTEQSLFFLPCFFLRTWSGSTWLSYTKTDALYAHVHGDIHTHTHTPSYLYIYLGNEVLHYQNYCI